MEEARQFVKTFNPYRKKYTQKHYAPAEEEFLWKHHNQFLKTDLIQNAISGFDTVGYFITSSTVFVGLDIDDHRNLGEGYLLNLYQQVKNKIGVVPSMLFKSPRGLHAYYFLKERIATELICKKVKQKLENLPVEVKPTTNTSLRIPSNYTQLDPITLQLQNVPFTDYISKCDKYHPVEVCDFSVLPRAIQSTLKERHSSIRKLKGLAKIGALEASLIPFVNGNTNDTFLKLCNVYRCTGLSVEEAFYRFNLCMEQSPLYMGDLRLPKRLLSKIKSEYKSQKAYIPGKTQQQKSLYTDIITSNIISLYQPYHMSAEHILTTYQEQELTRTEKAGLTKRSQSIKRFIEKLVSWVEYQDLILATPVEAAVWDYMYRYWRKNRREGLYPLPAEMLRNWNDRYNEIIDFFELIGLVEASGYQYSKQQNICKYYRVNLEKFINPLNKNVIFKRLNTSESDPIKG